MKRPMRGGGSKVASHLMRQGGGSIAQQFNRQTYMTAGGASIPWPKTKAFGNRPAPAKTLQRTGSLMKAWTGLGGGGFVRFTDRKIQLGVDPVRFPHAARFQSLSTTLTRPKRQGAGGRSAMHWKLGLSFAAWISDRRLSMGLKLPPRRLGINPRMLRRVGRGMKFWILDGNVNVARNI